MTEKPLVEAPTDEQVIESTAHWIEAFVVKFEICPFAAVPFKENLIHYRVERTSELESCLKSLIDACLELDRQTDIETTLLIYPAAFSDFQDYLDYLEMANRLLAMQGYEGTYQLASFHPHYVFEGTTGDDASNYTNRSPFPMLHLLREASLERAIAAYGDTDEIPVRNVSFTREKGHLFFEGLLESCRSES